MRKRIGIVAGLTVVAALLALWPSEASGCWRLGLCRGWHCPPPCPPQPYFYYPQPPIDDPFDYTVISGGRAATPLKRVRVLMLLDTDGIYPPSKSQPKTTSMKATCEAEKKYLKQMLDRLPKGTVEWENIGPAKEGELSGTNATLSKVRDYYASFQSDRSECLLFYYHGHGATDPVGSHYFAVQHEESERFYRSIVRDLMIQKRPGLVVMLSSSCAVLRPAPAGAAPPGPPTALDVPRDLLLMHRGVVDINSASKDQVSYATIFPEAFRNIFIPGEATLAVTDQELDPDGDKFVQWEDAFRVLARQTHQLSVQAAEFNKYNRPDVPNAPHTPHAFYRPGRDQVPDNSGP